MAVSLSASLPLPEAMCIKASLGSACSQNSLGDSVSRVAVGCTRKLKRSRKLKLTVCQKSNMFMEVGSCFRTSLGLFKLSAAGFNPHLRHGLFMDNNDSQHTFVTAVATIASETCLARDESSIVGVAEQAVAFAAAALDAAKYAQRFSEGEHFCDSFPLEQDKFMLRTLSLSEFGNSGPYSSGEAVVPNPDVDMSQNFGKVTVSSQRSNSRVELRQVSTEMSEILYDFRKVLEEIFSGIVEQESHEWNEATFSSSKSDVVVKSARRKERTHNKDRVGKKIEKIKGNTESLHCMISSKSPLLSRSRRSSRSGFLRTIRRKRLLTSAEEKQLSRRVQFLLKVEKLKAAFEKSAGREPTIQELANATGVQSNDFQRKLWAARQGKARMIYCNFGLVISIAKGFEGRGIPLQDLVQEGVSGLIRSIEKFKPSLGYKLSTYAHWWIWEAISRAVNTKSKAVLLPVNVAEILSRINKVKTAFSEEHGRLPTEEELAKLAKVSLNRLRVIQFNSKAARSADKPVGPDDFSTLGAYIADESSESYQAVCNRQYIKEDVEAFMLCLTERERKVVKLRFPAVRQQAMTLEDIGFTFNLTRERIRQIERSALQKLRCPKGSHLKSYFEML